MAKTIKDNETYAVKVKRTVKLGAATLRPSDKGVHVKGHVIKAHRDAFDVE